MSLERLKRLAKKAQKDPLAFDLPIGLSLQQVQRRLAVKLGFRDWNDCRARSDHEISEAIRQVLT